MIIALIALFIIGLTVIATVTVATMIDDIRSIRQQQAMKKHPHSRKWRERPTITVISTHQWSAFPLQKKSYRKLVMNKSTTVPQNSLILNPNGSNAIEASSLMDGVQRFNNDQRLATIAITPKLSTPTNIWQLLEVYRIVAQLPFDTLRTLCDVSAKVGVSLSRSDTPSKHSFAYSASSFVMRLANLIVFIYACYAAAIHTQPELLLIYLTAFNFWLLWAFGRYRYFSFTKKCLYVLLSPVSYVYFVYLLIAAPIRPVHSQHFAQNAIIKI